MGIHNHRFIIPSIAIGAGLGATGWWHVESKKNSSLMRHVLLEISMSPLGRELGLPLEWESVWGPVHVGNFFKRAQEARKVGGKLKGSRHLRAEVCLLAHRSGFDWEIQFLEPLKVNGEVRPISCLAKKVAIE